jgi:hypothetical protein
MATRVRGPYAIGGFCLCVCLALAGCDDSPPAKACLPQEAKAILDQGATAQSAVKNVEVLFDGSGSMAGYLRVRNPEVRPIPDIVQLLRDIPSARGEKIDFFRFGRDIHPVADPDSLAELRTYACNGHPDCDNQESHIDAVIRRAAQNTAGLTIVVTDLWLSNNELSSSDEVALGTPLRALFDGGRSVELLGLRAPYRGSIDDLPNGRRYNQEVEHPLFVLLIGPLTMVEAYRAAITGRHSPAFAPDRVREVLFTPTPFQPITVHLQQKARQASVVFHPQAVLPQAYDAHFQQFHVSHEAVEDAKEEDVLARAAVPLSANARPNAEWSGPFKQRAQIWMLQEDAQGGPGTCPQWLPFKDVSASWNMDRKEFKLDAKNDLASLPSGHTYLLAAWLEQTGISSPNPASSWMRDWSITQSNEDAILASKPEFFPTLNLELTAAVLEARLSETIAAKRPAPQGVVAAVRLED